MRFLRFKSKAPDVGQQVADYAASLRKRGRFMTLIMDTGNLCNVACRFCHISTDAYKKRKADNLTADEFTTRFAPLLPHIQMLQLSCGAEPTMNPNFIQILETLRDFEGRIQFSTNGMILRDDHIEAIASLKEVELAISIDGCEKDTVEWLRDKVKWDKLLERTKAVAAARDAQKAAGNERGITLTSAYSIVEQNIDQIPGFVPLAKELGFDIIRYRMVEMDDLFDPELVDKMVTTDFERISAKLEEAQKIADEVGIHIDPPDLTTTGEAPVQSAVGEDGVRVPYCNWPYDHIFVDSVNVRRTMRKITPCPWWPDTPDDEQSDGDLLTMFEGRFFNDCREAVMKDEVPEWCQKCPMGLKRI